jgi:hypothetical protein
VLSQQPFTGDRQQSTAVAGVDSGSQQYSDYSLQDYSVQQLYALLVAVAQGAIARGLVTQADAAQLLESYGETKDFLKVVQAEQLALLTKHTNRWKESVSSTILSLLIKEHGEEHLSQ